jgi:hypothetical protein
MKKFLFVIILLTTLLPIKSFAEIPRSFGYQGYLTDTGGAPIDGTQLIDFHIYSGDSLVWASGYQQVSIVQGYFTAILGASPMPPFPEDMFRDNPVCSLGVTVGIDSELPLVPLVSTPYSFQARTADIAQRAIRGRDLYHNILDINPNSITKIPFIAFADDPDVKLYLYGSGFQGALARHSHIGNNAHSHDITGVIGQTSVAHTHIFSGTTANGGAAHTHTGTTSNYSLAHTHTGNTNSINLNHSHSISVAAHNLRHNHSGATAEHTHRHNLIVDGFPGTGNYLVHTNDVNGLSCSDTADRTCLGSIELNTHLHGIGYDLSSSVGHSASASSELGSHSHSFTTGSWGGNHNHTFTTGSSTATHSHSYTGTTSSNNIAHTHTFDGTIGSTGSGLSSEGVESGTLPQDVSVYIDEVLVAGPFSGEFTSGVIDLGSFFAAAGEHVIEIREEGGNGGRLTYNLYVE